jgi:hypothetical protein
MGEIMTVSRRAVVIGALTALAPVGSSATAQRASSRWGRSGSTRTATQGGSISGGTRTDHSRHHHRPFH